MPLPAASGRPGRPFARCGRVGRRETQGPCHVGAEHGLQARQNHRPRPLEFRLPASIVDAHRQDASAARVHERHTSQIGADGHAPGARQLLLGKGGLPQQSGDDGVQEILNGLHVGPEKNAQVYHSFVRLVLASASPRRADLLTAAGYVFDVDPADTDESVHPGEGARDYALRVARDKAAAVRPRHPDEYVIAADTIVVVDGAILGKPQDEADASRMLGLLAGRVHEVVTAVVVTRGFDERCGIESTQVTFGWLTPDEIAWYVGSGEPRGKAGAYAIQGLASRFVTGIVGSYSNVVGLPVALVCRCLRELGYAERSGRPSAD